MSSEYQTLWKKHQLFRDQFNSTVFTWTGDSKYIYNDEQKTSFSNWIDVNKMKGSKIKPPEMIDLEDFNQKQSFIYKIVEKHYFSKSTEPLLLNCFGRPGTGKSEVIHALQSLLGDKCQVAAYVCAFSSLFYNIKLNVS